MWSKITKFVLGEQLAKDCVRCLSPCQVPNLFIGFLSYMAINVSYHHHYSRWWWIIVSSNNNSIIPDDSMNLSRVHSFLFNSLVWNRASEKVVLMLNDSSGVLSMVDVISNRSLQQELWVLVCYKSTLIESISTFAYKHLIAFNLVSHICHHWDLKFSGTKC